MSCAWEDVDRGRRAGVANAGVVARKRPAYILWLHMVAVDAGPDSD